MKLHVGERLQGTGPAHQPGGYLVTDVVRETPWYGLYTGKKILYNFDFSAKRVRETDDKEWLDVYLRTLHYPRLDDHADVAQRRALARAEVTVLGNRGSNLWPEAIDLLETENTRDAFTFAPDDDDREPIVVFARPHGQPLGDWQQSAVPVASLLSVLAELLEFLRQAHAEGLLLQGLGPAAIVIDRADRVHYIGSDMVTELKELGRVRRLFPPERYPRGFASPEFFDPAQRLSPRSDLYAWGTLAYFLFTGHMPWQIALEQDRPWAEFQPANFNRLDTSLRQIPPAHVQAWAEQLGLDGAALLQGWPANFVAMMHALLHPSSARRPRTADEVRDWMLALPPPQVNAVVALTTDGGETRVHVDGQSLEAGAEIEVRRAMGQAPAQPDQGDLVYAGPIQALVNDGQAPLTEQPYFYTVFARKPLASGAVYSAGVSAQAIEPVADTLLALADAEAANADGDALPPRLALCFQAMDPLGLAETLLQAQRPAVRGWALARLGDLLAQQLSSEAADLVRRSLRDPEIALRRRAALIHWRHALDHSDDTLLALTQEMGAGALDDAIQAAQLLRGDSIADDQIQRVVDRLEGERPTTCPLCGIPLPRRERVDHMRVEHGYVEVDGTMMPRPQAATRLWQRVFTAGDLAAHRQLLDLYGADASGQEEYAQALEAEIIHRPDGLDSDGAAGDQRKLQSWEPWLNCLRQAAATRPLPPRLMRSGADRARAVGRALVLTQYRERWRGAAPEWHRLFSEAAPGRDLLDQRIRLSEELPQIGVDPAQAAACRALFQEELPVACPECPAQVRAVDLELHLRRAHGIFQFRGERRSYADTRDYLLVCVCGSRPDVPAWRALDSLVQDRHDGDADDRLAAWVCRTIKSLGKDRRNATVAVAADAIARAGAGPRLVPVLLGDGIDSAWKNLSRHMALEIVARQEERWPEPILARIKPYLSAKDIPAEARQNAVVGLLRSQGLTDPQALEVLQAYVSATSKHRAVERLQELEQRVGQAPVLETLIGSLEDRIRMNCPRCQMELERRDMVKHLWDKHRLLLEGRQVREPWRVLADWVVDYGLEKDPALLERCRDLARRTDPDDGLSRLQRLLLRQGVEDRQAWNDLLARAREQGASLCPYCYAQAPLPAAAPPLPLGGGRHLEGHGYSIRLDETGLRSRLRIAGPAGMLYDGAAPDAAFTRLGAMLALSVPVALAAFGLLYALLGATVPWVMLLVIALSLTVVMSSFVYMLWPQRRQRPRLLEATWQMLVPELLSQPWTDAAGDFLGSLAAASVGQYIPDDDVFHDCVAAIERDPAHETALVPFWRLELEATQEGGDDPAPLVADRAALAFAGKLPLRLLSPLLSELRDRWPKGRLLRLQALLSAKIADAGLDDADLADLLRVLPVLGSLLGNADLDHMSQFVQLWRLRSRWAALLEKAVSVFDLARDAGAEKTLSERPDLLILSRTAPIHVGTRGVWLKDVCITEMPKQVDVVASRWQHGEGFEIVAGVQRVWFSANPNAVADELEKWLRFYFTEFLPQATKQRSPRASDASRRLWRANAVVCPECHRPVVPLAGEVGLRSADAEAQLAS